MKNEKEGTPFPLETVYLRLFAIGSGEMFRKRDGMSFTQRTQGSQRGVPRCSVFTGKVIARISKKPPFSTPLVSSGATP
jgi:hypothetical protein